MRIAIIGNSGSGKSVLARRLAGARRPVLDLDRLAWEPGQVAVARDPAAAVADLEEFCRAHAAWVVEGCYATLVAAALRHGAELILLDPGLETCLRNCRNRPWEPHKYATREAQDGRLAFLLAWVRDYYLRDGDLSQRAHLALFERCAGPKRRLASPLELPPGYPIRGEGALLLDTARLRVRRLSLADAPFILRLLNEPSFIEQIADRGVRTLAQAEAYLEGGPLKSYAVHGHGLNRVELKDGGEPIGICGLIKRDRFADVDLGYALLPEFEGHGYVAESAAAVLAHGARELGLARVIALVSPGNGRSIRVLEKLGFAAAGQVELEPGDTVDLFERGAATRATGAGPAADRS
jgi:RimJ/RimL family protein N-acetyltransferase/adenylate kinase family enzyme